MAVALAGIILTALLSHFFAFVGHQVRVQDERAALETVRFLFVDLSREMYFGSEYICGKKVGTDCRCLAFTDQLGRRTKVWYDAANKQVKRAVKPLDPNPNTCGSSDSWVPFTDAAVSITDFVFEIERRTTKQPRVQIQATAEYMIDGVVKDVSFKSQVTRRIFEPDESVLSTFVITSEREDAAIIYYFAFGPDPLDPTKTVCRDGSGNVYVDSYCGDVIEPVAAEFTGDGLYILGNNGLLFFISQTAVDTALGATGPVGSAAAVFNLSSVTQGSVVRVLGKSGGSTCRFCTNDPRGIISIHPAGGYLYAKGRTGTLYKVNDAAAERVLEGGLSKNTAQHIAAGDSRVLVQYRNSTGSRTLRLFSNGFSVSPGEMTGSCTEFAYVPTNAAGNRCRQIHPDPNISNVTAITPSELTTIPFRFIDALQVINGTISLWYRDTGGKNTLSVGSGASKLKRSDDIASGGVFAYGNGLTKYTSVCKSGAYLCAIDSITDTTIDTVAAPTGTTLTDHLHFKDHPVGITNTGKLAYFSGASSTDTAATIAVYNKSGVSGNTQRVLCSTNIVNNQQVTFKHLSDKHPTKELVAAIGESVSALGPVKELYLLQPTNKTTHTQFSIADLGTLCGLPHTERYHLPVGKGPSGGLDLVRLTGVIFKEVKP